MTEENNDVQSTEPEQSEQSLTLDDLYSEFKPQETQTPQSAPQQPEVNSQNDFSNVPDPVTNTEGFTQYMGQHSQELAALRNDLMQTKSDLDAEKQELATKREEEAFNELSSEIAKQAGVETDDIAPHLLFKFVKDENFQQIWQNRSKNPGAFKKVQSILANEMKGKVKIKTDPQLQENDRAMNEAINSASNNTRQPSSLEDKLEKSSDREFDTTWQRLLSG